MSNYNGFTPARAKANAKYISKFAEIKLRVTPEERENIKAAADAAGKSMNEFILSAIAAHMTKDGA